MHRALVDDAHGIQTGADDLLHRGLFLFIRLVFLRFFGLFGLLGGDGFLIGNQLAGDHFVHAGLDGQLHGLALIDLFDDGIDLGQQGLHELDVPALHGLGHDGVVGVGKGLLGNLEGLVKAHALQLQQTDQLWDGDDRVRIVELNGGVHRKAAQVVAVDLLVALDNILAATRSRRNTAA